MVTEQQPDINQNGPWFAQADEDIRSAFGEYVKNSHFPEEFQGIALGVRPPVDRGFRIIRKHIGVKPASRGGTMAPCNLCGPAPKFKNEGMLIVDELGWLYLIGPDCGAKHYEQRFRDEERRFDFMQAERMGQEYLLLNIENFSRWEREALLLKPHAEAAEAAFARFGKSRVLVTHFRQAFTKNDGWLQFPIQQEVLQPNGDYKTEFHQENVVRLKGQAPTKTTCQVGLKLAEAIAVFQQFGDGEETALDLLAEREMVGKLGELANAVRAAVKALAEVRGEIRQFQDFFSVDQVSAIENWANDWRCPISLKVECSSDTRTFEVKGAQKRYPIDVSTLLRPIPEAASS